MSGRAIGLTSGARAFVVLGALLSGAASIVGCDACTKRLPVDVQKVPVEEAEKSTKPYLRKAADLASTLCGVPVAGLEATKLEADTTLQIVPGTASVRVEGKPIPSVDAGKVDLTKLALCAGTITVMLSPEKNPDGTAKEWRIYSARVTAVTTPGVKWEPPKSGGGGWD
jgi:hypothetical protein